MKGLILAAGEGTRMYPLTRTRPKSMLPVANKPIVQHIVESFKQAGIKNIVVVSSPDREVRHFLKSGRKLGVKIDHVTQEKPTGTAAAIKLAEDEIEEDFIVINGDNLIGPSFLKELGSKHKTDATLGLFEVEDVSKLSSVVVEGETVTKIVEKPPKGKAPSNLAGIGIYAFSPRIFDEIEKIKKSKRGELELPDAIQNLIEESSDVRYVKATEWQHVSYPWDILKTNADILKNITSKVDGIVEKNATLKGEVKVGEGTTIRSGAYIEGPVVIGENCDIGPNCYIRPSTSIGDNCKIGQSVEVKNSVIFDSSAIPHLNYVGDSVIGKFVNLGAGTILTNLRHDDMNVHVNVKGDLVDTGRRKLGAIVADGVKFGSNVVVNPGRTVGPGAVVWPSTLVNTDIAESEEFKGNH